MAIMLSDGTVLPSNMDMTSLPGASDSMYFNNRLKFGIVSKVLYPDDQDNISKLDIEYHVLITERAKDTAVNASLYRNCRLNNIFGNLNNSLTYTLHAGDNSSNTLKDGSQVIVLAIDGNTEAGNAIILGGITSTKTQNQPHKYTRADGQFYDFNFNGINININKDGEYSLKFNSVVDFEGKKINEAASGTEIKIDKEGRISILDNEKQSFNLDRVAKKATWTNEAESITIDKQNKKIDVVSSGTMSSTSKKDMSLTSNENLKQTAKRDINISAGANASLEAKQNLNQKVGANWTVKVSGNTQVQAGGNVTVQAGGITQFGGTITKLGAGNLPVAVVGISTCIGVGNLGAPVLSTIITGSSTVFVGT